MPPSTCEEGQQRIVILHFQSQSSWWVLSTPLEISSPFLSLFEYRTENILEGSSIFNEPAFFKLLLFNFFFYSVYIGVTATSELWTTNLHMYTWRLKWCILIEQYYCGFGPVEASPLLHFVHANVVYIWLWTNSIMGYFVLLFFFAQKMGFISFSFIVWWAI